MNNKFCLITFFSLFFLFSISLQLAAQQQSRKGSVHGQIVNSNNEPVFLATVFIEGTTIGTSSDENGHYLLEGVPAGNVVLVVSGVGFEAAKKNITVTAGKRNEIPTVIVNESQQLAEATVIGKSEVRRQQEQAFAVAVLDVSKAYNTSADLGLLTNRIAGIKIREEGGVGSGYSFTLNGFSGRQVKFFMDGLSMDNFGASFGLNNLPASMVERVEVYKGVLPVGLGADALGGAVNIVTRKAANYIDASYSYGSFNTHKGSVNAAFTDKKTGFTARLNAFFNYSDNDYKVFVPVVNLDSNRIEGNRWVKRFHDGYKSGSVRFETGLVDKSFADYLLVGIIASGDDKDIQTGVVMDKVYGARTRNSTSLIPSLRYKKSDLFVDGLGLSFYGAYSHVDYNSIDTANRIYNWLGDWIPNPLGNGGERARSQMNIISKEWRTNTNLDYTLNNYHTISFNHVYSNLKREISDIEDPANEQNQIPQSVDKHILGLGWMAKYERWNATVFGKMYQMTGKTYETNTHTTGLAEATKDYTEFGYGAAFTYFVLPKLQAKLSYENTYRLPEASEMFGDNQENTRNANLKPETSHNINLGLMYEIEFLRHNTILLESNFLLRDSKDFIHKELKQPSMQYINLGKVKTTGVEVNAKYSWKNVIHAGGSFTYQHIIDNRKTTPSQTIGGTENENFNYKNKLPNIPFLYGNANAGLSKSHFLVKNSELTVDYFLNYVKEYYLAWPSLGTGDSKAKIPGQLSHDVSVGYSLNNGQYNISFECNNITNETLYDNYKLQKPGRFFNIKLRYYISK